MAENPDSIDLKTIYPIITDEIRFAKSQQWTLTYYILLLYSAILGVYLIFKNLLYPYENGIPKTNNELGVILIAILAIFIVIIVIWFGYRVFMIYDKNMDEKYRKITKFIEDKKELYFSDGCKELDKAVSLTTPFNRNDYIKPLLYGTIFTGGLILIVYLLLEIFNLGGGNIAMGSDNIVNIIQIANKRSNGQESIVTGNIDIVNIILIVCCALVSVVFILAFFCWLKTINETKKQKYDNENKLKIHKLDFIKDLVSISIKNKCDLSNLSNSESFIQKLKELIND